jgi:hypothetical protein
LAYLCRGNFNCLAHGNESKLRRNYV